MKRRWINGKALLRATMLILTLAGFVFSPSVPTRAKESGAPSTNNFSSLPNFVFTERWSQHGPCTFYSYIERNYTWLSSYTFSPNCPDATVTIAMGSVHSTPFAPYYRTQVGGRVYSAPGFVLDQKSINHEPFMGYTYDTSNYMYGISYHSIQDPFTGTWSSTIVQTVR